MISRRILAAVALLCALCVPAWAQKTKSAINSEIASSFPNNTTGFITPALLSGVTSDIVNSIMPTAPVVSGNLACFNGTTGLLQDCGNVTTSPFVVSSSSSSALAVGPNGATNPAFQVDASASSLAAGLKVAGAATGGTVAIAAIDSGSATNLSIDAKGTGQITIAGVSTGAILIPRQVNLGLSGSLAGSLAFLNATSGLIALQPPTGALGSAVLTLPDATDTLTANAAAQTLTNKTIGAATLSGALNGAGNQINNVIVGASTPLAGSFTAITGTSYTLTALLESTTAPVATTFCATSPSIPANNGTAAFTINVGTSCSTSVGTITMPSATTGWVCHFADVTSSASNNPKQTGGTQTTVTLTNYSQTAGTATNWTASEVLRAMCTAY